MRQQTFGRNEKLRLTPMPHTNCRDPAAIERPKNGTGSKPTPATRSSLVGCAGWSPISGAVGPVQMQGSQLERYASVFDAVEINSSFYRPHRRTTYARWADSVPEHFRFSVKLPRTVTHALRLANADALMAQFEDEIGGLEEKLGCLLVQLPPSLQLDLAVADAFFKKLRARCSRMLACEARHPSWFEPDATALLKAHAVTRVIADPPKGQSGTYEPTTSSMYLRLHGSPRMYYSSYSDEYLAQLADTLQQASAWTIFDNTASGAALGNALTLLGQFRSLA